MHLSKLFSPGEQIEREREREREGGGGGEREREREREREFMFVIYHFFCFAAPVEVQSDAHLDCRGPWVEQTAVTIVCTIDRTSYPSKCTLRNSTKTQFRVSRSQLPYLSNCSVSDFSTCAPSASPGCHCTAETAAQYTLEYRFIAHQDYEGSWQCDIPGCLQGPPPLPALSSSQTSDCKGVQVEPRKLVID